MDRRTTIFVGIAAGVLLIGGVIVTWLLIREWARPPVASVTETPEVILTLPADQTASPTPQATPTLFPGITLTAAPTAQLPATGCLDRAAFVGDVSIPDGSVVRPGQAFTKTWRLRNEGTCTWTPSYALVLGAGNALSGPAAQALGATVPPGGAVDISVNLAAPTANGDYRSKWFLRNEQGALFGLGEAASRPLWAEVPGQPPPTATSTPTIPPTAPPDVEITDWRGEYFRGRDLSGSPAIIRNDRDINFDWHGEAPDSALPGDNFSARWTRDIRFEPGIYRFRTVADDGVRVWLGDARIIDNWTDGVARENVATLAVPGGTRTVRVEYYEASGAASVQFGWERVTTTSFPDWQGRYWANASFDGDPVFARNDRAIDYNWQGGAVFAGMPADNFSVRWTREVDFEAGVYR